VLRASRKGWRWITTIGRRGEMLCFSCQCPLVACRLQLVGCVRHLFEDDTIGLFGRFLFVWFRLPRRKT